MHSPYMANMCIHIKYSAELNIGTSKYNSAINSLDTNKKTLLNYYLPEDDHVSGRNMS
jgi:hypothetical protein